MSKIKVRLVKRGVTNVKLKPQNGIKVKDDTTYLYDPTLVAGFVDLAEDWATKTDGKLEEDGEAIDYSAKAYAIGGTGTETNNARYFAEQASDSATSASNSATTATTQAGIATTQAGIATTKAGQAATSEYNAEQYSISAGNSATSAANSATAAYSSEVNAASSSSTATTQAGIATTKAGEASSSASSASGSALSASTSATNAQTWAEGTDVQVSALGGEHSSKGWAKVAKDLVDSLGSVLRYKGSVATYDDLPTTGQTIGDVYNVLSDGSNYAWDGTSWDDLSGVVDLSAYRTSADQDIIDSGKVDKVNSSDKVYGTDSNGNQTTYSKDSFGQVDDVQVNGVSVVTSKIANIDLTGKQDVLTAGTGIDITSNVVSNTGVRSVSTGETNGTISVNTNGTSAEVAVKGLGSAAYTSSTDYATSAQGALADTALQPNDDVSSLVNDAGYITKDVNNLTNYTLTSSFGSAAFTSSSDYATSAQGSLADTALQPNDNISELVNDSGYITKDVDDLTNYTPTSSLATVATSGSYNDLSNKPTIGDATLTVQKNGTSVDTFTANATSNKTINITVPTQASDVNALPDSTKYGASLSLSINSSTYVVTAQLKDQDGNALGSAQTIDLPLESVVVSGSYDDATKKIILTLQSGSTIEFSVADLVSGLQTEITSNNMLDADLVDDSTSTNKFVTSSDITSWNGKVSDVEVNGSSVVSGGVASVTVPTDTSDLTNGAGYITSSALSGYATETWVGQQGYLTSTALSGYATETWVGQQGYITGITSGDVTTALGYTPYDASNPNGYTSNVGTVTSVNNVSPVNGNVTLSIPTVNDSTIAITQGGVTKGSFTLNQSSGGTIALDAGGSTYSAGSGIDITGGVISNDGVRSVSTGATNGTISVNTGGTSTEVGVYGLGSAAYTSSTEYLGSSTTADDIGGSNEDLSNLTSTGKNIGNWSSNVTNCITEIPQDIKIELSNGTITLKAGSKIYFPNGFEQDGTTPKFDVITTSDDVINGFSWATSGTKYVIDYRTSDDSIDAVKLSTSTFSGTSFPADAPNYSVCYRTDENKIYRLVSGTWTHSIAFPLAICTGGSSCMASIDQVFNGFGYIGSTLYALPGVKGLIPNGRNADGTLNNTLYTVPSVITRTMPNTTNSNCAFLYLNPNSGEYGLWYKQNSKVYYSRQKPTPTETYGAWYSIYENKWYENQNTYDFSIDITILQIGCCSITSGAISDFNTKISFQALDYNDKSSITSWGVPNYKAGVSKSMNTEYTAEKNGILCVYGYRGNGSTSTFTITINGVQVVSAAMNDYNIYANNFMLMAGDKYKTNNPSGTYTLKFFPLIGG